jgi:hypothetical protein
MLHLVQVLPCSFCFLFRALPCQSTVRARGLPHPSGTGTGGWITCIKRDILGVNAAMPRPREQIARGEMKKVVLRIVVPMSLLCCASRTPTYPLRLQLPVVSLSLDLMAMLTSRIFHTERAGEIFSPSSPSTPVCNRRECGRVCASDFGFCKQGWCNTGVN